MAKKKTAAKAARPAKAKSSSAAKRTVEPQAARAYAVLLSPDPFEIANGDKLSFSLLAFDIVNATLIDWDLFPDDPSAVSLSVGSSLNYQPASASTADVIDVQSTWSAGVAFTGSGLRSGTLTVTVVPPSGGRSQKKLFKVGFVP